MGTTVELLIGDVRGMLLGVAAPVVVLLLAIALSEQSGLLNFERIFRRSGITQPVWGAIASAVPGCAGSLTLTRLFGTGAVGVGTLYAAHFATLGDAAFVLWSGRPLQTLALTGIVLAVGVALGLVIERTPVRTLLAPKVLPQSCEVEAYLPRWAAAAWLGLLLLALGIALFAPDTSLATGVAGGALAIASVLLLRLPRLSDGPRGAFARALETTAHDAAEIMAWVILADVAFTLANGLLGGVLVHALQGSVFVDVVIAAAIGLIPGCGPQIVVASLFVAGDLPFAALVANTLSQHGDAIFPLLRAQRQVAARLTVAGGAIGLLAGLAAILFAH